MCSYYHSWSKKFIKNIFLAFILYFCERKCLHRFSIILSHTYFHYRFQFKCCSYALLLFFLIRSLNSAISLIHECLFVCLFVAHWKVFFSCLYLKGKNKYVTNSYEWKAIYVIWMHILFQTNEQIQLLFTFPPYLRLSFLRDFQYSCGFKKWMFSFLNSFHYNDFVAFHICRDNIYVEYCFAVLMHELKQKEGIESFLSRNENPLIKEYRILILQVLCLLKH